MKGFAVRTVKASVADVHGAAFPSTIEREVWFIEPTDRAVVLGSTQDFDVLNHIEVARQGLVEVRRHSGGGAVVVVPESVSWFDLWLPAADPCFETDVSHSARWVGEAIVDALGALGVPASVATSIEISDAVTWGGLVCFAGVGAGEVLVGRRKAVGISQRRTRAGARFQVMVLHHFDPVATAALFVLGEASRVGLIEVLQSRVQTVAVERAALREAIKQALLHR